MNPTELNIFYEPASRLRLTILNDRSYLTVKPAWAAPLSRPNTYLALLDEKGDEITVVADPRQLSTASWQAAEAELRQRYLNSTVLTVHSAKQEYGATYWSTETDRGPREFITQALRENAQWITNDHLLLLDVDGNRFDIPSIEALDPRSRSIVHGIL